MSRPAARSIPFGSRALDVPDGPFVLDEVEPPAGPAPPPLDGLSVSDALDRPVDTEPLDRLFRGARSVLVAVSDATRATAADRFLPALVERIEGACGARAEFIVASGIHRRPTAAEIESILGPELARGHATHVHDPDDPASVDLGTTGAGTRVRVDPAVRAFDRLVLTGSVGFHYYAGFTGGRKAVVPGLASRETVTRNHLRALRPDGSRDPAAAAGVLEGNPVHRDMHEGAALVAPDLLINAVPDGNGGIERLFVGHWRTAHEQACRYVASRRSIRLRPRDLVVASAGGSPTDRNLIQSHKAFEAGARALRPGGVFVLVASCAEGPGHEDFLPWFRYRNEAEMVDALRRDFRVYGQTALSWFRKAGTFKLILVSELDDALAREIGAEPAADLEVAFGKAARYIAAGTPGWLLDHGTRYLLEPVETHA